MWDGEKQAIRDACGAALQLAKYGFITRIAILPGKDPNELPPAVVRSAYWQAETVNELTVAKILLKNKL